MPTLPLAAHLDVADAAVQIPVRNRRRELAPRVVEEMETLGGEEAEQPCAQEEIVTHHIERAEGGPLRRGEALDAWLEERNGSMLARLPHEGRVLHEWHTGIAPSGLEYGPPAEEPLISVWRFHPR